MLPHCQYMRGYDGIQTELFSDHHSIRLCTSFLKILCKLLESAMGLKAPLLPGLGMNMT